VEYKVWKAVLLGTVSCAIAGVEAHKRSIYSSCFQLLSSVLTSVVDVLISIVKIIQSGKNACSGNSELRPCAIEVFFFENTKFELHNVCKFSKVYYQL